VARATIFIPLDLRSILNVDLAATFTVVLLTIDQTDTAGFQLQPSWIAHPAPKSE
jgi:hypothetical protein